MESHSDCPRIMPKVGIEMRNQTDRDEMENLAGEVISSPKNIKDEGNDSGEEDLHGRQKYGLARTLAGSEGHL